VSIKGQATLRVAFLFRKFEQGKMEKQEKLKVLVADDEPDIVSLMIRQIEKAGYNVISAYDGQEAWDKIVGESPDIILLDLTMPKMDGFAVLERLRAHPPSNKWQPVIIVSARGGLTDMQRGFSLEADHYLTKPCQMEDVVKGINLMATLIPQRKTKTEIEKE
jgi:CheY-like chemotaxis protein